MADANSNRLAWIDWMKSIGMVLIVLGHTGADTLFAPTPPFNFKQLGVAFFVFASGYSLARETRSSPRVLFNRLFEVYLFGGLIAIVISAINWLAHGDILESNYLPFILGINVFFDHFPANPTTWYIGTYLHLLLLWAVFLRHRQVGFIWLVIAVAIEICTRAALQASGLDYVPYQLVTNWIAVFLLGIYVGQKNDARDAHKSWGLVTAILFALLLVFGWPVVVDRLFAVEKSFPFERFRMGAQAVSLLVTSVAISFLYLAHTWVLFQISRRLPSFRLVEFFSRNTLIVFIVHMPLIYLLAPTYYSWIPQGGLRVATNLTLYFVLPALLSEAMRAVMRPRQLRDWLAERVVRRQQR